MNKETLIELLNKQDSTITVDGLLMDKVIIDVSRIADKFYNEAINEIKAFYKIRLNSQQREALRLHLIGYPVKLSDFNLPEHDYTAYQPKITAETLAAAYDSVFKGVAQNEEILVNSLNARINKNFSAVSVTEDYLEYVAELERGKAQLIILDATTMKTADSICEAVKTVYEDLANYRRFIIVFKDNTWSEIAKIALYMEQFKNEGNFNIFNKQAVARINEITTFIKDSPNLTFSADLEKLIAEFYSGVAYGCQFEDLFITETGYKILVMQKVELDETPVKCPACFNVLVRGNSYPKVLYKSFECQNPTCPSRSKIGRGKRFDLAGSHRQAVLSRNNPLDKIDETLYNSYRRDVIVDYALEDLVSLYSYAGDQVTVLNNTSLPDNFRGRTINFATTNSSISSNLFNSLTFVKFFKELVGGIVFPECLPQEVTEVSGNFLVRGNSSQLIPNVVNFINIESFAGAVTSPPYYNAREYSQWPNLLTYLVDMLISGKAVYDSLEDNAVYIYNIADIIGQDNVFVNSKMSSRRQMLGFYSIFLLETVGFKTIGNAIWDKGEVQSKRNSSPNRIPGYIRPVNAYEHCLIFAKGNNSLIPTFIKRVSAVRKINSNGENIFGHTAPYPVEIAQLILPFVKSGFVVDPFLGSGTTVLALNTEEIKTIGFELDEVYYSLAVRRVADYSKDLFSLF